MRSRYCVFPALALLAGGVATSVHAQSAAPSDGLDEVVVTAQKRSENLQKVPLAITAVTGEQLADSGVTSSLELNELVPGLNIRTQVGSFQPSIRGVSTSSSVVENPVALYVDGVYMPQQREGIRPMDNIDQLAVLKGPQGTLFGRNATGGVIQITTRSPSQDFQGEFGTSLDNYLLSQNDLYLNGGITDKISSNLSAYYNTQGRGWGQDLTNGDPTNKLIHEYGFMSKTQFDVSDDTRITLGMDYTDRFDISNAVVALPGTSFNLPNAVKKSLPSPWDSYDGLNGLLGYKGGGASVTVESDLGFADLKSISSYRQGSGLLQYDDSGGPVLNGKQNQTAFSPDAPSRDYTEELQLVSPQTNAITWVAGVFYFHSLNGADPLEKSFSGPSAPLATSTQFWVDRSHETSESVAPYGQLGWKFLDNNELTVGIRYTEETRDFHGSLTTTANNGNITSTNFNSSVDLYKVTYRGALTHDFSPDTTAYASISSGVKSGGFNIFNPVNPGYQPEKITDYETGLKTELFDHRIRFNSSLFYYDYTNIQVNQLVGGSAFILNGPSAELYGTDLDIEAKLAPGLKLTSGLEALHATFTDYSKAVVGVPNPAGGVSQVTGSATGNRLPLAQNYALTAALDYTVNGSYGTVHFNGSADFNGNYYFEADNNLRQGAYVDVNSSLAWTPTGDRYTVTLWGKNLMNNAVLMQANTTGPGYLALYEHAPRTFGVSGRVHF